MPKQRQDLAAIRKRFPSVDNLDWNAVFSQDIDLFGRVLRDIVKVGQENTGKPGPRAPLEPSKAAADLRFLMADEHTMLPFWEAATMLNTARGGGITNAWSIRDLAEKTGLNRNIVHRLLSGQREPDAYEIEAFAKVFGKDPSYFVEWRILYVLSALEAHMTKYPESSVSAYMKAKRTA